MRYGAIQNHSACSSALPLLQIHFIKEGYIVKHFSFWGKKKKKKNYTKPVFFNASYTSRGPQKPRPLQKV